MQVISPDLVKDKRVILRLELDVPIENGQILEDLKLKSGIPTLNLCVQNASKVIILGHLGRPQDKEDKYSLKVVFDWFVKNGFPQMTFTQDSDLVMYENTRFDPRENQKDVDYARELASKADFFVNEAFSAHNEAVSTTILPKILPHAAGFRFAKEVETLMKVRKDPQKPLVAIVGGAKVEDKYQAVMALSEFCDVVLVGGLLALKIKEQNLKVSPKVMLGMLSENNLDLADSTIESFCQVIKNANQVVWAGPVGKYEDSEGMKGNHRLAEAIIESKKESIIGGGDTTAALKDYLDKFTFVSTGGGAMLKLLSEGTLPTIQALA